uniref:Uncharacterized protein n=1 Tax=Plectus sambesii TaxID=2011161 RepID=A0A914XPV0_9BILA
MQRTHEATQSSVEPTPAARLLGATVAATAAVAMGARRRHGYLAPSSDAIAALKERRGKGRGGGMEVVLVEQRTSHDTSGIDVSGAHGKAQQEGQGVFHADGQQPTCSAQEFDSRTPLAMSVCSHGGVRRNKWACRRPTVVAWAQGARTAL